VSKIPTPEANWGKDNSSLILTEQDKALPASITAPATDADKTRDQAVREATGKSTAALLQQLTEAETTGKTFLQTYVNPSRERALPGIEVPLGPLQDALETVQAQDPLSRPQGHGVCSRRPVRLR
jgi:hypothetical protein